MEQLFNFDLITVGIAIASNLVLGTIVFLANKKSTTSRIFLLLTIAISSWSLTNYLSYKVQTYNPALLLVRLVMFFATLIGGLFFLFSNAFPYDRLKMNKKYAGFILLCTIFTMGLSLSNLIFPDIILNPGGAPKPVIGPGILSFIAIPISAIIFGIITLVYRTYKSTGIEKTQYKYLLLGLSIMFSLIILLNFVLPTIFGDTRFIIYSATFTLPFVIFTSYAIVKHHLLNIKIIATEVFTFVLSIITLLQIIFSKNSQSLIFNSISFILVLVFGIFLISSVRNEVEQREKLEFLTNQLQTANIRLQELDRQKTDFLSIAAHQLRTPLSILNGYIELIKDNAYGKVGKHVKEILKNMDESNGRLVKLVDDFLDITRIEQGRTKYTLVSADISKTVDSVVHELKDRAAGKGLKLKWEPPEKPQILNIDEEKVRHVIFNFIDNAIKYSEKGSISVMVGEESGGMVVKVSDNGLGFGKIDEASFFQKFYRGENVKGHNVTGTGLGLYVCRMFIEAHKGKIWGKSPGLGKGSEFGFWIPITNMSQ